MPVFSVCIPTYNAAGYLPEAIESVLAQTYEDFELLICDDASTDATAEVVGGFQDDRIRYVPFSQNLGQGGNFNRCMDSLHRHQQHLLLKLLPTLVYLSVLPTASALQLWGLERLNVFQR